MSSSEEQEAFTTTSGSPEQPIRRSARVALFAQPELAQEFSGETLSYLNILRDVLQESAEGQQILADFEGFPETQELEPPAEQRASTPILAISPRGIRIPHRTVTSLVRNRVSEFEARSINNIPTAGASGWLEGIPVYAHSTNNTPRNSPPNTNSPIEPINIDYPQSSTPNSNSPTELFDNDTPQGSPLSSGLSSVSFDIQEADFSLPPGLPQIMEGAVGGLGYDGDDPQNPPPYSPPDLGTPIWHRVMADLVDLREMVELVVANVGLGGSISRRGQF